MTNKKKIKTIILYRRVDIGEFVTEAFAKKYPNLTIREVRKMAV